jgi:hypothetical protein
VWTAEQIEEGAAAGLLGDLKGFGISVESGEDRDRGLVTLDGGLVVSALVCVLWNHVGTNLFNDCEGMLGVGESSIK